MTSPPSSLPENWQELLAGYALGDLTSEEAEEVQRLLADHPDLGDEVDQFQEVLALLPYSLPDQAPSPQLRDVILTSASVLPQSALRALPNRSARSSLSSPPSPSSLPTPSARSQRQNWQIWGGAIAAGLIAVLGVNNFNLHRQTQTQQAKLETLQQEFQRQTSLLNALRQPNTPSYRLVGTGTASDTAGVIVAMQQRGQVALTTNLEELPQDEVYRLWAMPQNSKTPIYCGQFTSSSDGTVITVTVTDGVCNSGNAKQMLITSEKASDPYVPKGKLVMESHKL